MMENSIGMEVKILSKKSIMPNVWGTLLLISGLSVGLFGFTPGIPAIQVLVWIGTIVFGILTLRSARKASRRITRLVIEDEAIEVHRVGGTSRLKIDDLGIAISPKAPRIAVFRKAMIGYVRLIFIDESNVDDFDFALRALSEAIPNKGAWSNDYDKSFRQIAFEQIMDDITNT